MHCILYTILSHAIATSLLDPTTQPHREADNIDRTIVSGVFRGNGREITNSAPLPHTEMPTDSFSLEKMENMLSGYKEKIFFHNPVAQSKGKVDSRGDGFWHENPFEREFDLNRLNVNVPFDFKSSGENVPLFDIRHQGGEGRDTSHFFQNMRPLIGQKSMENSLPEEFLGSDNIVKSWESPKKIQNFKGGFSQGSKESKGKIGGDVDEFFGSDIVKSFGPGNDSKYGLPARFDVQEQYPIGHNGQWGR